MLKEKAWLLTYIDLCRKNGTNWKDKVQRDFENFSERKFVSFDAIRNICRKTLLECGLEHPSVQRLSKEGIAYIAENGGQIWEDLLNEMNVIRPEWGVEVTPADSFLAQHDDLSTTLVAPCLEPAEVRNIRHLTEPN